MTRESSGDSAPDPERVAELFAEALDLEAADRAPFLDDACAGEPALRRELDSLLEVHGQTPAFLSSQPAAALLAATLTQAPPGARVGPYRLLGELGRGGMGTVYLAERADGGFDQQVALKLIRGFGFASQWMVDRFLRERQILARLEHPNIARLLDGGIADDGAPWFAMELVRGTPLTASCDDRRLPIAARLELFEQACRAVQHAHANLVVHRDLKPSNMLVAEDGSLKLLDFGIAKVLSDDAAGAGPEATALTRGGLEPLTPEYAAPEQIRGEVATTATDVYALGVVLYELLTGARPSSATATADPYGGLREPEPMSSAIVRRSAAAGPGGVIGERAPDEIAAARATTPARLRRALAGDLEAIARQALQPAAKARYASVEALAEDVRRFRAGQPVRARAATLRYRVGKLLRRHRVAVAAAALVAVSMVSGLGASLWQAGEARDQAVRATVARRQALAEAARARRETERAEKIADFLKNMILEANPTARSSSEPLTLLAVVQQGAAKVEDQLEGEPGLQAQMMIFFGDLALSLEDLEGAARLIERSHAIAIGTPGVDTTTVADAEGSLGQLRFLQRRIPEAEAAFESGLARLGRRLAAAPTDRRALAVSATLNALLAQTLWFQERIPEAIERAERALALDSGLHGAESAQVAVTVTNLGVFQNAAGRLADAERSYRRSLALHRKLFGPGDTRICYVASGLAGIVFQRGQLDEAYGLYQEALAAARKGFGPTHREVASIDANMAKVRIAQGRFAPAQALLTEAAAVAAAAGGGDVEATIQTLRGELLARQGRRPEAVARYRQALSLLAASGRSRRTQDLLLRVEVERLRAAGGEPAAAAVELAALVEKVRAQAPSPASVVNALRALGEALAAAGRTPEAVTALREAVALGERALGPDRLETARAELTLGLTLAGEEATAAEGRAHLAAAVRRLEALGRGWWAEVAQGRRLLADPA